MRWRGRRQSQNVEYRGAAGPGLMKIGGGIGTLVLLLVAAYFGIDPGPVVNQPGLQQPGGQAQPLDPERDLTPQQRELADFAEVVLADTEDVWNELFSQMGETYQEPQLVIFNQTVESACGFGSAASGPFYCPADRQVYLDLSFYEELEQRFEAPGDFAQAYVLAHEVGHHVQNLLGISEQVQAAQSRVSREEANELSVRLELQADFFAGVWAHHNQRMKNVLEPGDIEEALNAAHAIGDDRLQMEAQGYIVPESFSHGSSEQRARWFRKGFETGDINAGDTFNTDDL